MCSYFGTDPGDITPEEMFGREPVPVPRPSEPLPNDERNRADIVAALASGDPLALLKIKSRLDDEQIAELKAELARRSPSVPTAIQEQRDTERLDWLGQFATISARDARGVIMFSNHWYEAGSERQATIREAIDTAKSAARVQGENSQ